MNIKELPTYEVLLYHLTNGATSAGIFVGSTVYGDGNSTIYTETVVPVELRPHTEDKNKQYAIEVKSIQLHRIFMNNVVGVSVLGEMPFDGDDSLIAELESRIDRPYKQDTPRIHGVPI